MACVDKHHFAGGTERGYQFLSDNPHLVGSFITSTKPGAYVHTHFNTDQDDYKSIPARYY